METQAITSEELAPDTGKPVSKLNLGRFGAGFIFFCVIFMMSGTIGSTVLLPARFDTLGIGQGETILGTMNSIGIIFALISNVIFGALSDSSRSRFGKRTPWIIVGGPIAGIGFYLTSISPTLVTIVASWSLLQVGLNCMLAPCVAILSDRVPQKYRGTMSAFYGAGQIVGQSMGTIIGSAFINAPKIGFLIGTVCWFLCGVGTVLLIPRELPANRGEGTEKFDLKQTLMQFRPPTTGASDFYKALVGRLLLIFGYNMIVGYQLYVCMRYIGQDKTAASATVSTMAVITMVVSLVVSLASGPISDRLGKRKLPVFISFCHHRSRHRCAVAHPHQGCHAGLRRTDGSRLRHLHGRGSSTECGRAAQSRRSRQGPRHSEPCQHSWPGHRPDCRFFDCGGHWRLLPRVPGCYRRRHGRCCGHSLHQEGQVTPRVHSFGHIHNARSVSDSHLPRPALRLLYDIPNRLRYSVRSAMTGSLCAALRAGSRPPIRVMSTLRATSIARSQSVGNGQRAARAE